MASDEDVLHILADGSRMLRVPVRILLNIPVWQGNRVVNFAHVEAIAAKVGSCIQQLDFGYRSVRALETDAAGKEIVVRQLVDGQHRQHVLRRYFEENPMGNREFKIILIEKPVVSELETIEYFNTINTVSPIKWSDKNLVVNAYLAELEAAFNTPKNLYIRKINTRRPFVSADKLRQILQAEEGRLQTSVEAIRAFVGRVRAWNAEQLATAAATAAVNQPMLEGKDSTEVAMLERAIEKKFMLGTDPKFRWVRTLL